MYTIIALSTLLLVQCGGTAGAMAMATETPPPYSADSLFDPQIVPTAGEADFEFASATALSQMPTAEPIPPGYVTRDEMQAEIKRMAWRKGDFTIIPYGTIWGSMSYDSQRSKIGDYCLWFESPDLHQGDADFNVDAKSTRLGFDFAGPFIPQLGNAKIGGKVEVDFQGQFITRNKPGLLLRHAYVEAKNERFRLLVGQTWDVISPLGIPTLNYTAGSAVGNLAYRRAQFRAERYLDFSDCFLMTLQGSVNGNVVTDFVSDSATTTSADPGPYPDFQARTAFTLGDRDGSKPPTVLGIGGHYGIQSFDFRTNPTDLNVDILTYSCAADFVVPVTPRLGVQGEFFTGFNLSCYMGGILQGVDRVTHKGIHATGGWIDLYYNWRPNLHTHTGFAIDDPSENDMTSGRIRNQMIFTNILWEANKNLQFGLEVDVWQTHYMYLSPGEGVRLEFATKYTF